MKATQRLAVPYGVLLILCGMYVMLFMRGQSPTESFVLGWLSSGGIVLGIISIIFGITNLERGDNESK